MSEQLKLAREIIAKDRPLLMTVDGIIFHYEIKKIRNQLRKEILEEFDKVFEKEMKV